MIFLEYIHSPFNYTGGKYKQLPQLNSIFPEKGVDIFCDLFGGSFEVGLNSSADRLFYNDVSTPMYTMIKYFMEHSFDEIDKYLKDTIEANNLTMYNTEEYKQFRQTYNESSKKCPLDLYILLCYCFNNDIRFNKKGEMNQSFGKNRSHYNPKMQSNLQKYIDRLHQRECVLCNQDFREFDLSHLEDTDLVYCDPPYLNTLATYNKNKGWIDTDEHDLYKLLDSLDKQGTMFALSNLTIHDGKENTILTDWIKKNGYNIHGIESNYSNCMYNKKNRDNVTNEIVVTNIPN